MLLSIGSVINAQEVAKTIPSVKIKNLKGELVNTSELINDGKPFVLSFGLLGANPASQKFRKLSMNYILNGKNRPA